jgi:hypothetical protein
MLIDWLVFPLMLAVLALGCGLLLERVAGVRLPGVLLLPAGLATIVVAGLFPILSDATAELTMPLIVLLAVVGLVLSPPWRRGSPDRAAVVCAVAVFCAYAAPIVLSGEATIAGYPQQRENPTYLGLVDHFMEHGRNLDGLEGSEYKGLLSFLLPEGYPLGSLVPLGVGQKIVGQDVAWLFQPYMAFLAAMLALSLYGLVTRIILSRPLRATAVFVASQPALLFALALWAGVRELAAAWVLALFGALLTTVVSDEGRGRALLPLSVAAAAMIGILSFAGAIWIAPLVVAAFVLIAWTTSAAFAGRQAAAFLILVVAAAIPSLVVARDFWAEAPSYETGGEKLFLLVNSLSPRQAFGIWPVGDFQSTPDAIGLINVLIGLVLVAAVASLVWAVRRRAWEFAIYVGGAAVAALAFAIVGSPWVDMKAFAIISSAVLLAALVGALVVPSGNRRVAGAVIATAIAAGVVVSNVLTYHDADLAPRDRLHELESVADRVEGKGPTLLFEHEPYATRHFLREALPDGAPSNANSRELARPGKLVDIEQYGVGFVPERGAGDILKYRTIVRRISPLSSRPSSAYRLVWRGRYYEIWQQVDQIPPIVDHVAFGTPPQPASVTECSFIRKVAALAGRNGRIAAVVRPPVTAVNFSRMSDWRPESVKSEDPVPDDKRTGVIRGTAVAPATDHYTFWITGDFYRRIELLIDGEPVAKPRREHLIEAGTYYVPIGSRRLTRGSHRVELRYDDEGPLRPGIGGYAAIAPPSTGLHPRLLSIGPLVLQRDAPDPRITYVARSRARDLCGKSLDWLEPTQ